MSNRLAIFYLAAISAWGQFEFAPSSRAIPVGRNTLSDEEFFNQSPFEFQPRVPPATVSADQLRHPLSRKGKKMILQAQNDSRKGDHAKAIEELQLALRESSAAPYAHSILGSEYLRIGQVGAALSELEKAVTLLPHDVATHSNLGYALYLAGQRERGREEVRLALSLDTQNLQTRHVLGILEK